jgi:hypothetical protein
MKKDFKKFEGTQLLTIDPSLKKKSFCEILEEECNTLLKTRFGLKYLLLRFPNLSVSDAVKEFKTNYIIANEIT